MMIKEGLETYANKAVMKKHEAAESVGKEKKEEVANKKAKDPKKLAKALLLQVK